MDLPPGPPLTTGTRLAHFLIPSRGAPDIAISLIVNAFFAGFNSRDAREGRSVHPIASANACPRCRVTALHYYVPWAISALSSGRRTRWRRDVDTKVDLHTERYFAIAERPGHSMKSDAKLSRVIWLWPTRNCRDGRKGTTSGAAYLSALRTGLVEWVSATTSPGSCAMTVAATLPGPRSREVVLTTSAAVASGSRTHTRHRQFFAFGQTRYVRCLGTLGLGADAR